MIKRVFVIGGETRESDFGADEAEELRQSCRTIGRELAKADIELVICSPFTDSADYFTAVGYADAANKGTIHLHFPSNEIVIDRKKALTIHLARHCKNRCPRIVDWLHPAFPRDDRDTIKQAWLFCQLQALEQADAVVAIGGKVSGSASTLLHLAELRGLPIIPFTFLGGAAKQLADRINWADAHPSLTVKLFNDVNSPKKVLSLMRKLVLDDLHKKLVGLTNVSRVFLSRSKKDTIIATDVGKFLKQYNIEVLFGDEAIVPERAVIPAINEYIKMSELFIVFWSANYALSPWCYDELMLAFSRFESNKLNVLIFNMDETDLIPLPARRLGAIPACSATEINRKLQELLDLK